MFVKKFKEPTLFFFFYKRERAFGFFAAEFRLLQYLGNRLLRLFAINVLIVTQWLVE